MNGIFVNAYELKKIFRFLEDNGIYFSDNVDKKSCFSYLRLIDGVLFFQVKEEFEEFIIDSQCGDRMEHESDILCVDIEYDRKGGCFELLANLPISFVEENVNSLDIRKEIDNFYDSKRY